jgi:hypothetical protein
VVTSFMVLAGFIGLSWSPTMKRTAFERLDDHRRGFRGIRAAARPRR